MVTCSFTHPHSLTLTVTNYYSPLTEQGNEMQPSRSIQIFDSQLSYDDGRWPNSLRSRSDGTEKDWSAATQSFEHREVVIFYSPLVATTVGKPFLLSASRLSSYLVTGTCRPDELLTRTNIWRRQLKGGGEQCQTGRYASLAMFPGGWCYAT